MCTASQRNIARPAKLIRMEAPLTRQEDVMEPLFYVMAILGCGDAETACQQVRLADQRFATAEACMAASPSVLLASSDLAFPVVMSECRRSTVTMADVGADAGAKPNG